jgi:hypothetical protein
VGDSRDSLVEGISIKRRRLYKYLRYLYLKAESRSEMPCLCKVALALPSVREGAPRNLP